MGRSEIRGSQIRDESIASVDLASGSIKAGELHEECISGQPVLGSADSNNDRLLIWDANGSPTGSLKQIAPSNLGIGGSGSPAGSNTEIQFNDGGANFGASSNLTYDGTTLKVIATSGNPVFSLETTDDSSSAGPIFTLKRNSSSPADADYLGQIKFQGENDADQEVLYAKITGKIDDASDSSEDGILEFANIKAGSQTITARLRSDSLQLLNSTNLTVDGSVGIGTTSPDYELHVAGNIGVDQYIYHNGDSNTNINFTDDKINLKAGNISMITMEEKASAPHEVRINNGGNNIDFLVEDNSGNAYFVADASTSRVGIGTESPSSDLTINGTEPKLTFRESDADRAEIGINDSDNLVITNQSTNKFIVFKSNDAGVVREGLRLGGTVPEVVVNEGSESLINFRVESDNNTHMLYVTGSGKVGIGTSTPQVTLHVHADSINDGAVTISQSDDSSDASQLDLSKSRGSGASPTAVQNSDFVGQIRMLGYDGNSYDNFADIFAQAAGTISTTSHPTKVVIRTTQASATSPTTAVTIDENQNMTVAGSVYGKMRHMTHHRYNDGSGTGKEYIPWAGTSEQPSPSYISMGVAPYNGRLAKVLVRSSKSGGLGSTVVGMHIGTDGTATFNTTAEETVTVNMASANTTGTFSFTSANHFAAGDTIAVSIDPTSAHGNVNVTCVWEYDITA